MKERPESLNPRSKYKASSSRILSQNTMRNIAPNTTTTQLNMRANLRTGDFAMLKYIAAASSIMPLINAEVRLSVRHTPPKNTKARI